MSEKTEMDAEVAQYLSETAIVHDVLIRTLLNLQELSNPGFSDALLNHLDSTLGQRPVSMPEQGWINIRARLRDCLQNATDAAQAGLE